MTCSWVAGNLYVNILTGTITLKHLHVNYLMVSPGATVKLHHTTTADNIDTVGTGRVVILAQKAS